MNNFSNEMKEIFDHLLTKTVKDVMIAEDLWS